MQGIAPAKDELLQHAPPSLVLCPLHCESRALAKFGKLPVLTIGPGAEAMRAAFANRARWPVPQPRLIVLCGLAGALHSDGARGDARSIRTALSLTAGAPALTSADRQAHGSIVESPTIAFARADKLRLHASSHADLVDSESYTFASCAEAAGIPWAIVRGVSDDLTHDLPREVAEFIDAQGRTRYLRVLAAVARRPKLALDLLALGRIAGSALRNAAFAADALGCLGGIDLCSPSRPLVLYGGSFDPPHMQHAVILRESVRILRAPCAIVMPAAKNPLKRDAPPATPDARLALCRANFGNAARDTGAEVRLSTLELNRAGASYTVDTVIDLIRAHPHLRGAIRVLIGSDAVRDIERWRRWEELLTLATPAIVVRPPDTLAATRAFLAEFAQRSGFLDAPNWVLPIDSIACASTTARSDLAQGARPDGLADAVFDEITARRLYGFGDQR